MLKSRASKGVCELFTIMNIEAWGLRPQTPAPHRDFACRIRATQNPGRGFGVLVQIRGKLDVR